jgi:hypothetical protein
MLSITSTSACPLATVPPGAQVVLCFNTTLQPGVLHGFLLEQSVAQPPGFPNGAFDRTRLNHPYVLASPQGYVQLLGVDPGSSLQNQFAVEAEFNGVTWFDVLRLHAAANGPPQNVSVVVYWADAPGVADEIRTFVDGLSAGGVINSGQSNALLRKVTQALDLLAKGKKAEAIAVLQGLIQQANNLTLDSVLSPDQSAALIARVQYMIQLVT